VQLDVRGTEVRARQTVTRRQRALDDHQRRVGSSVCVGYRGRYLVGVALVEPPSCRKLPTSGS
jgi:hypothetical protein